MGARTGEEFLAGLRSRRREVWLGGERVDDVTAHPALAGAARALADVFDRQHEYADDCLVPDPETGEPINVSHLIPRSKEDLQRRHRGLARIAESTVGLMGRTPDYMNVTFAGFAGERGAWLGPDGRNEEGVANLQAFQRQLAREDICLTHTIVHPTIDRARDTSFADNPVPLAQGGRHRARHRRAGRAHPRHAGALRRRDRGVPRPPAAAGRHRPLRAQLLHPHGHARASSSCAATARPPRAPIRSTGRSPPASTSRTRS